MVKAREYQEEKEALKAAKEQAKYDRKIKRAANALRKKQDDVEKAKRKAKREAKAAERKLAKDLAVPNKPAKKALKKKPVSTTTKAKKAALTVPIRRKVSTQSKAGARKTAPSTVVALIKGVVASGVVAGKTSTRTINLPQRFR